MSSKKHEYREAKTVFVTDGNSDRIYACTFSGSCSVFHEDPGMQLMDIKLLDDNMFYSAWNKVYITRINIHTKEVVKFAENAELGRLGTIAVYSSSSAVPVTSSCSPNKGRANCSTLCLPSSIGYTCACADGVSLLPDGKTCSNVATSTTTTTLTTPTTTTTQTTSKTTTTVLTTTTTASTYTSRTTTSSLPRSDSTSRTTTSSLPRSDSTSRTTTSSLPRSDSTSRTTTRFPPRSDSTSRTTTSLPPRSDSTSRTTTSSLPRSDSTSRTTTSSLPRSNSTSRITTSLPPRSSTSLQGSPTAIVNVASMIPYIGVGAGGALVLIVAVVIVCAIIPVYGSLIINR
ncbi:uncharacterized protein LOC128210826 [Mya arenaria]|uniref:uncharacterized protein LOC128210826 n=1 Tax=Mya arenaria TaxID=6604 RepID=UPI0022E589C2|nr:uncharacterized protein LOC128210826 [Mya arenaria]